MLFIVKKNILFFIFYSISQSFQKIQNISQSSVVIVAYEMMHIKVFPSNGMVQPFKKNIKFKYFVHSTIKSWNKRIQILRDTV